MRGWCFFPSWWCSKFNSCQVVKDKETNPSGAQKKEVTENIYFWRYILKTNFQEAHDINRPLLLGRYFLCVCFRWVSQRAKIPSPCLSTSLPPPHFWCTDWLSLLAEQRKGMMEFLWGLQDATWNPLCVGPYSSSLNFQSISQMNSSTKLLMLQKNHYSRVLSVQQFVIVYSLLSEKNCDDWHDKRNLKRKGKCR